MLVCVQILRRAGRLRVFKENIKSSECRTGITYADHNN